MTESELIKHISLAQREWRANTGRRRKRAWRLLQSLRADLQKILNVKFTIGSH